jgi:hypothetical protein
MEQDNHVNRDLFHDYRIPHEIFEEYQIMRGSLIRKVRINLEILKILKENPCYLQITLTFERGHFMAIYFFRSKALLDSIYMSLRTNMIHLDSLIRFNRQV